MKDEDRTKEDFDELSRAELINELAEMRQRIVELEASETERKRAEEALRESETKMRSIFRAAPIGIGVVSNRVLLDVNERFSEITGYSRDELIGKDARMVYPSDEDYEYVGREKYAQIQERGAGTVETRFRRKDGEVIEVLLSSTPLDPTDLSVGVTFTALDITERKRAEERFRLAAESTTDLIYEWDVKTDRLDWFGDIDSLLGYEPGEISRTIEGWVKLIHPDDLEKLKDSVERHRTSTEPIYEEYRILKKYGSWSDWTDRGTPILDSEGRPRKWVGACTDITERKRAEEALRRRAEELATLQATVLDITAPHDLPTLLQTIVERAARLIDTSSGGLYLCDPDQKEVRCVVSYNTPRDYTGTVLKYGEGAAGIVAQTGEPLIIDDYRTWSGRAAVYEEEQPFTAVLTAPMIWRGQVTGIITVLHDVEKRRFTQANLDLLTLFANHAAIAVENARLYEKALQDAKTKSFLVDEVNHRVNNTLVAIIGLLNVEQDYAEMADQAMYEAIIQNLTNRVSGLATVHGLLSASEWAPLPLSDLVGQVIKSATQMCPRDKQVFIDAPPSPVRVTPDQAHNLALVINELATNTIKHTLPGRSTARISVRIALEDDGLASHAIGLASHAIGLASHAIGLASHAVLFEYRDDGPGYPEDVLQLERHAVGFDLIKNLTRQSLRGELSLHNDEGAVAVIRFPAQA